MTFPVYLSLFGHRLHPHLVMELIAYTGGFQLYRMTRSRWPRANAPFEQALWLFVGAVFGALVGSKVLAWIESLPDYWPHRFDPQTWMGGKTIVGGLLGGWAGVEIAKKLVGVNHSTGDAFVFPLIFGMSVGRIGCFLTGLDDHTYGVATTLPWGVDFGDGVFRHPTQLYDIVFLTVLALALYIYARTPRVQRSGVMFRLFLMSYLLYRVAIEMIKPVFAPYAGLSAIQLASLYGTFVCLIQLLTGRGLKSRVLQENELPIEVTA
ncbi:MAG TPA: prolipoprotein diacylglyceryl transferase family protein [Tepidisphaeraceae bacterium]|jgi:phosphatidylglycerol:prolipoprotein diacylglycerol transferase|nr:prolipoprotein diacylglyceryl transferase family protein [Tepidisphaeraceae bacterium]